MNKTWVIVGIVLLIVLLLVVYMLSGSIGASAELEVSWNNAVQHS